MISRDTAYTSPRPDILALVPMDALSVLDAGCSNGELGASLRRAAIGRVVTGIEIQPKYCVQAQTRLDEVICADLNRFDWLELAQRKTFDCIVFADVLEHVYNPSHHLDGAGKCLKPGGVIIVSLPNIRHITAFYSIFIRGTFPRRARGLFDSTHLWWFTYRDAVTLLNEAGFQIVRRDFNIRLRDRGDGILNKLARRILGPIAGWGPIREFLAYQYCFQARRTPE